MRFFLTVCFLTLMAVPAYAQDATKTERQELAQKLSQVNPVSRQIEATILRVAGGWGLSEKEKFKKEMMIAIDMAKIEQASVTALADTFTKEELQVMLTYYSAPEAAKIAEKMPIYQSLIQPGISSEIDRALMKLRTGYEAQQKAAPAAVPAPAATP